MNRRTLVGSGVILLLVGVLAGYLYAVDSTGATPMELSTITVSTSASAYDQVADSFANHILFLSERNATALAGLYTENATLTWTGAIGVGGLAGLYNGTDILLLMRVSFIGKGGLFTIGNVTRTIDVVPADSATVNSTFAVYGRDYFFGRPGGYGTSFNGTVSAHDSYMYSGQNNSC
jgi:hypothetical protein